MADNKEALPVHRNHLSDLRYAHQVLHNCAGMVSDKDGAKPEITAAMTGLRYIIQRTEDADADHATATAALSELRAEVERLRVDAERYRQIRELGSQLKIYVYDDESGPDSGDWLYKPSPERIDMIADELVSKLAARSGTSAGEGGV